MIFEGMQMSKRENKPVVSLATNDAGMECGDTSPLSDDETCLVVPKRGHVRALQICAEFRPC